jgi:transcriptional regulator with XRE-family HTH domain
MAKTFRSLFKEAESDVYWGEWATIDFAEELQRRMELAKMSRTALAEKLGVSQAYITKVLRGDGNLTVRSLAKLARAVDSVVRIHLAPVGSYTVWHDVLRGGTAEVTPAGNELSSVAFTAAGKRTAVPAMIVTIAAAGTSS